MATFDDIEKSIEASRPVELYTFTIGTTTMRYTSAEGVVSFSGSDYEPLAGLKRSNPSQGREQKLTAVTVTLPSSAAPPQYYVAVQPSSAMSLTVLRVQPDAVPDTTSIVMFDGFVTSVQFKNKISEMRAVPFNEEFSREMPRFQYQGLCNHVLYDARCKLTEASFKFSGTVIGVNGNEVQVASLPTLGVPYIGGYLELPDKSEQRLIIDQVGATVTILFPFRASISGGTIDAYEGCDHTPQTCAQKFSNILNYGGFPFVPTSNPFQLTQFTKE